MQFPLARLAACALLAIGPVAGMAQSAVQPPPRPPGSLQARPEPGLNEAERKRYVRAHHDKFDHHRDYTRDDSVYGPPPVAGPRPAAARNAGPRAGAAGVVQDGAGTGPAREKTDRGASSGFFGKDKK
jgi:hypothetical protein